MNALELIGGVVQIAGLACAAAGVVRTRREYAPEMRGVEDRLIDLWRWLKRCALVGWYWISRVILRQRRSVEGHLVAVLPTVRANITGEVYSELRHGELDPSWSIEQKIAELDRRTRGTRDRVNEVAHDQRDDRKSINALDKRLTTTDVTLRDHVSEKVRTLAVGGLRLQAWGLSATAVGTVVVMFGS